MINLMNYTDQVICYESQAPVDVTLMAKAKFLLANVSEINNVEDMTTILK